MDTLLEIPLNRREAKERGISPVLARFVLTSPEDDPKPWITAWRIVESCRPVNTSTFVHPIGPFLSTEALSTQVDLGNKQVRLMVPMNLAQVLPKVRPLIESDLQ